MPAGCIVMGALRRRITVALLLLLATNLGRCNEAQDQGLLPSSVNVEETIEQLGATSEDELSSILSQLGEGDFPQEKEEGQKRDGLRPGVLRQGAQQLCDLSLQLLSSKEKQVVRSEHLSKMLVHTSRLCTHLADTASSVHDDNLQSGGIKAPGPVDKFLAGALRFCSLVNGLEENSGDQDPAMVDKDTWLHSLAVCQHLPKQIKPATMSRQATAATATPVIETREAGIAEGTPVTMDIISVTESSNLASVRTPAEVDIPMSTETSDPTTERMPPEADLLKLTESSNLATASNLVATRNLAATRNMATPSAASLLVDGAIQDREPPGITPSRLFKFCGFVSSRLMERGKRDAAITAYGKLMMRAAATCSGVPGSNYATTVINVSKDALLRDNTDTAQVVDFCYYTLEVLSGRQPGNPESDEDVRFARLIMAASRMCEPVVEVMEGARVLH